MDFALPLVLGIERLFFKNGYSVSPRNELNIHWVFSWEKEAVVNKMSHLATFLITDGYQTAT